MEAIRKIVTIKDNTLNVTLPDHFNNTEVELIILPVQEKSVSIVQEPVFDYKSLYGSVKFNKSIEEIDNGLKELREEWERDIS